MNELKKTVVKVHLPRATYLNLKQIAVKNELTVPGILKLLAKEVENENLFVRAVVKTYS